MQQPGRKYKPRCAACSYLACVHAMEEGKRAHGYINTLLGVTKQGAAGRQRASAGKGLKGGRV